LPLFAVAALACLHPAAFPAPGLDPSWHLATEFAGKRGLVFGRDYVFTYGPYYFLVTRLFDPATFPYVLLYDALSVAAIFGAVTLQRSWLGLAGAGLWLLAIPVQGDVLALPALFAVFLLALRRRSG
jgi:hypothetical protein